MDGHGVGGAEERNGGSHGASGGALGAPPREDRSLEFGSVRPVRTPGGSDARRGPVLRDQVIEQVPVTRLKRRDRNARLHPKRQIEQLAAAMGEFGFVGAIIADQDYNVLAGYGRLAAAELRGMEKVPVIRVHHLDDARKVAFALADNRLPELSSWDDELLKLELKELESVPDLEVELTGFDTVDLDRLWGPEPDPNGASEDVVPEPELEKPAVSRLGDLWDLGDHRLLCGNALDADDYQRLLGEERAAQVVTDPPYNVRVQGHVSSKGFREFPMACGEMTPQQFTQFNVGYLNNAKAVSQNGAIFHVSWTGGMSEN